MTPESRRRDCYVMAPEAAMWWRDLSFSEKWNLVAGSVHAVSTFGLALVAIIGLSKVAPIIVYQVEQQRQEQQRTAAVAADGAARSEAADVFVGEVLSWWTPQVEGHQRILDLVAMQARNQARVAFAIERAQPVAGAPEILSDYLIVTATPDSGAEEIVRVPVNESAVSPNQYIQYRINHGAFAHLNSLPRQAVEGGITGYLHHFMVPKAPPAYVESDMTLRELSQAISDTQAHRVDALKHIRALRGIIDVSLETCRQ